TGVTCQMYVDTVEKGWIPHPVNCKITINKSKNETQLSSSVWGSQPRPHLQSDPEALGSGLPHGGRQLPTQTNRLKTQQQQSDLSQRLEAIFNRFWDGLRERQTAARPDMPAPQMAGEQNCKRQE
ncbi:Hypothetical predicted protein, partial [Pelobates cultripes]